MIVMKFGGTSLANRERIEVVKELVEKSLSRRPLVVVSAHSGVTDILIEMGKKAIEERVVDTYPLEERHEKLLEDLDLDLHLVEHELTELRDLLRGIRLVRELTPRSMDYVLSFGERMSSKIVAAYLKKCGIEAQAFNSYDLGLLTDSNFGRARHKEVSEEGIRTSLEKYEGVPVITGFLGKNEEGEITTLGRSGSDYSASIIGSAMEAEEIQIWTDVDGIMSADPRVVEDAISLEKMSFDEASELAYYGARVIHPSTMLPAVRKNIPIRVLNTYNPQHPGTLIIREVPSPEKISRAIAYKRDIFLINIVSTHMLQQHGFMARIFQIFAKYEIVLDIVATSEVSVSMTTDSDRNLDAAREELSEFGEVTVEKDKAILCVVGEGLKSHPDTVQKIFSSMAREGIRVDMISQGATRINVSLLLSNSQVHQAVQALHRALFD